MAKIKTSELLLKKEILGISATEFFVQFLLPKTTLDRSLKLTGLQRDLLGSMFDLWLPNHRELIQEISLKTRYSANGYINYTTLVVDLDGDLSLQVNPSSLEIVRVEEYEKPYELREILFNASENECLMYLQNPEKFFTERILNFLKTNIKT